jgi:RNA polymerase sigma-70 factor (ECF subfamily)
LTQADQYLLEQIRQGSADGWAQMVGRYQGRLTAFARSRLGEADAEDMVQETFLAFLTNLSAYRSEASLETYLFSILRRKIADCFRGRSVSVCLLQDVLAGQGGDSSSALQRVPSPEATASWYAARREEGDLRRSALTEALCRAVDRLKDEANLRDLQIVEMLFYCRLRNQEAARQARVRENYVAVLKHRFLKDVRELVQAAHGPAGAGGGLPGGEPAGEETLLADIWETRRPSCLKRSTVGAWLLGTLESPWADYVDFHLHRLGCRFCQANLEDLRRQGQADQSRAVRQRIMASTVGFLPRV